MRKIIFLLTLNFFFSYPSANSQAIASFINEINYLTTNPLDRGLEIAAEAGTDLDGWSVVVYLADGTVDYTRYIHNRVVPNQQNGYGTVWMEMEQGSGDGVAIADGSGNLLQFLSYGNAGLILASEGAAAGLTSKFIGLQLLPENALQLTGTGMTYLDFAWSIPGAMTPDGVNTNQILGLLPPLTRDNNTNGSEGIDNQFVTEDKEDFDLTFNTYPNPCTDFINIDFSIPVFKVSIAIFDLKGQLVYTKSLSDFASQTSLDISQFETGQYLAQVSANGTTKTTMIFKH